jgi:hypothetical protein
MAILVRGLQQKQADWSGVGTSLGLTTGTAAVNLSRQPIILSSSEILVAEQAQSMNLS